MDEIINGDAYELIKSIPDKSVDLIVTDPPYEFGSGGHNTGIFKTRTGNNAYNEITDNGLDKGIDAKRILPELKRVMKRTNIYLWCNKDQIKPYLDFFLGCNFEVIIWGKSNPPTVRRRALPQGQGVLPLFLGAWREEPHHLR